MYRFKTGLLTVAALTILSCSPAPPDLRQTAEQLTKPQDRLILAIQSKDLKGVEQALADHCDPNAPGTGYNDLPPLHVAVLASFTEGARLLIDHNADVNLAPIREIPGADGRPIELRGDTPLHTAVMAGAVECAKLLIARKADINAVNGRQMTPLDMAISHTPLLEKERDKATKPEDIASGNDKITRNTALIDLLKANGARSAEDFEAQKLEDIKSGGIIGRLPPSIRARPNPHALPKHSRPPTLPPADAP